MKLKKGKLALLAVASVALIATLVNDKKKSCCCKDATEECKEEQEEKENLSE